QTARKAAADLFHRLQIVRLHVAGWPCSMCWKTRLRECGTERVWRVLCRAPRQRDGRTAGSRPGLLLRPSCPLRPCGNLAGFWAEPDGQPCFSGQVHPLAWISLYYGDEKGRCRLLVVRGFRPVGLPTRRHAVKTCACGNRFTPVNERVPIGTE